MKNEESKIFSVNPTIVLPVKVRVGLKSLIEESEENLTMKRNIKYYSSDDDMFAF
jgi:hypothetical protein